MKAYRITPNYYDEFECTGNLCRNTCCQRWNIFLDKEEYNHLKRLTLSQELKSLREKMVHRNRKAQSTLAYGIIKFSKNGMCPMLSTEHLCRLQMECGEKALSHICKKFPRKEMLIDELFETRTVEQHLSLGCEAVVELLLKQEGKITYLFEENVQIDSVKFEGYIGKKQLQQRPILKHFLGIRQLSLSVLQCRRIPLEQRILTLGLFVQQIEDMEKKGSLEQLPEYVDMMTQILEQEQICHLWDSVIADERGFQLSLFERVKDYFEYNEGIFDKDKIFKGIGLVKKQFDENNGLLKQDVFKNAKESLNNFLEGQDHVMEQLAVTLFVASNQPFRMEQYSLWENYAGFVYTYQLLTGLLIGTMSETDSKEEFIQTIVNFARTAVHSDTYTERQIQSINKNRISMNELAAPLKCSL